ncbi:aspartate/glutamate racemase family protein [Neobacillus rhizosphaerae]|uniref:aspartate/glutamate racemase family protein n=1 Tax=Neobacillus rhizosphaerae TaxID=2880965 RepID=UPI003D2D27E7
MKLAIIHTTPVTIEPLKKLAEKYLANYEIINFLDDSILPSLLSTGGNIEKIEHKLIQYSIFAKEAEADIILFACSSVGEVAVKAEQKVSIPVERIDEAMAEQAIHQGDKIAVIATLSTTLNPTVALLKQKADIYNMSPQIITLLANEAYTALTNGDKEMHDTILANEIDRLAAEVDIVVLAQASMARVLVQLPEKVKDKCLTSPELGMKRVQEVMKGLW